MLLEIFSWFESVSMLLRVEHTLILSKCYCGRVRAKITGVCVCNKLRCGIPNNNIFKVSST